MLDDCFRFPRIMSPCCHAFDNCFTLFQFSSVSYQSSWPYSQDCFTLFLISFVCYLSAVRIRMSICRFHLFLSGAVNVLCHLRISFVLFAKAQILCARRRGPLRPDSFLFPLRCQKCCITPSQALTDSAITQMRLSLDLSDTASLLSTHLSF